MQLEEALRLYLHCTINLGDWHPGQPSPGASIPKAMPYPLYCVLTLSALSCMCLEAQPMVLCAGTAGILLLIN